MKHNHALYFVVLIAFNQNKNGLMDFSLS